MSETWCPSVHQRGLTLTVCGKNRDHTGPHVLGDVEWWDDGRAVRRTVDGDVVGMGYRPAARAPKPRGTAVGVSGEVLDRRDTGQGRAEAKEGMDRALAAAHDAWKDAAWQTLVGLCRERDVWTTDDFWLRMAERHPDAKTHEPRALGALMQRVIKTGLAEKVPGVVSESIRPEAHRAIVFHYRTPGTA